LIIDINFFEWFFLYKNNLITVNDLFILIYEKIVYFISNIKKYYSFSFMIVILRKNLLKKRINRIKTRPMHSVRNLLGKGIRIFKNLSEGKGLPEAIESSVVSSENSLPKVINNPEVQNKIVDFDIVNSKVHRSVATAQRLKFEEEGHGKQGDAGFRASGPILAGSSIFLSSFLYYSSQSIVDDNEVIDVPVGATYDEKVEAIRKFHDKNFRGALEVEQNVSKETFESMSHGEKTKYFEYLLKKKRDKDKL